MSNLKIRAEQCSGLYVFNQSQSFLSQVPNSIINQVVHAAGHDLRAPLVVLQGYAQLLQRSQQLDQDTNRRLSLMVDATKKMDKILYAMVQLVDYQTLDKTDIGPIHFKQLLREIKFELTSEIETCNPQILSDFSGAKSYRFSRDYIFMLIKHLLQNALVHNCKQQDNLIVKIQTKKEGNAFCLVVEDNGQGMDLSDGDEKLYQPFYRHSFAGNRAGVGLSLVKTILDRTGGSIQIFSKPGEGTQCMVTLPLQ